MREIHWICCPNCGNKTRVRLREDTLQLVLEAETEEQRCFYEMVGGFLLQEKLTNCYCFSPTHEK